MTIWENIALGFLNDLHHELKGARDPQRRARIQAIRNSASNDTQEFLTSAEAILHVRARPGERPQDRSATALSIYSRWHAGMTKAVEHARRT